MRVIFLFATVAAAAKPVDESGSKVEDLEGKIKAIKQNDESMRKYVPEEYLAEVLNRTKSELAALEARLKAAKLEESETKENKGMKDKKGGIAGTMGTNLLAETDLLAELADDDSAEDPTVKGLLAKLKAARLRAAKLKAAKAKEAEEARLKAEKAKEEKKKEEKGADDNSKYSANQQGTSSSGNYSKYTASQQGASSSADYSKYYANQQGASSSGNYSKYSANQKGASSSDDYSKYYANQQGASSGNDYSNYSNYQGASPGSKYLQTYAPTYAKYANTSPGGSKYAGGAGSSPSASANLAVAVGMHQSVLLMSEQYLGIGWASETVYFFAIGMAAMLAWRFVGFSSDRCMHHWMRVRRRALKIDPQPFLEEFGVEESP